MKIEANLTYKEMLQAGTVGLMRMVENVKNDRKETHGETNDHNAWGRHVEGAMAEMAFCKHYGLYWGGVGEIFTPDVHGTNIEVRWTHYPSGKLIVQRDDKDDHIYWLLTGRFGRYFIHGFMLGADAKQEQWWPGPKPEQHPAYFVPQNALSDPSDCDPKNFEINF
jgi:hypothetical protein